MTKQVRIRPGVVVINRGNEIYVGHLQKSLSFSDSSALPILHQLREWISCEQLVAMNLDQPGMVFELITRLGKEGFIEIRHESVGGVEMVISHMNEVGILLTPLLINHGFMLSTLDSRHVATSDICGQYLRMSDIGVTFKEIIAAQNRELINSGKSENRLVHATKSWKKIVIITAYPEPELLALLMAEGYEYLCAIATPFGAEIGPFVKPGVSPCFFCIELWRSEMDDQWQKIAAALFMERKKPVLMTSALMTVAALAEFLLPVIQSEIPHENRGITHSLTFERGASEGIIPSITSTSQRWSMHPECSCHWGT